MVTANSEVHELQSIRESVMSPEHHTSDDEENSLVEQKSPPKGLLRNLGISFFLFGLINNVLYVVILSAALDLVPPSTPKGIILFFNIFPALVAKIGWPYVLKGRIRYWKRIVGNCAMSVFGMILVAGFEGLWMRLLGIGLASFSSGLGELTFLQLSTTYSPPSIGGHSIGYFASGTGAAGLVGAFLWWEVRGFGVRTGVGLSAIMPFVIPLTYRFLLPSPASFSSNLSLPEEYDDEDIGAPPTTSYAPIPSSEGEGPLVTKAELRLRDKWRLVRPLFRKFMLPLFCVYTLEYTINQGIAPTLLYPVPNAEKYRFLSWIIHSVRDYYPLWQLVYQTTVFFSRSSISLGVPPLPARLLALPAVIQGLVLLTLMFESARGIFKDENEGWSIFVVGILVGVEGICGGLAYVNVFYRINQLPVDPNQDKEVAMQEKEFKIGSIGFADSLGILCASAFSVPMEVGLCRAQVQRGKMLCKGM